jgi:hypothetical protein
LTSSTVCLDRFDYLTRWFGWTAAADVTGTTRTLGLSDPSTRINFTNVSGCTITVPTNAVAAIPLGSRIFIKRDALAGSLVLSNVGVTITNGAAISTVAAGGSATLFKTGTNNWDLSVESTPLNVITHLTSMPEVGANAWRITSTGGNPSISNGGLVPPAGDSLFYLGSRVPTVGGKFSVGFEWEAVSTAYPAGIFDIGLNVSISSNLNMLPDGGGIQPSGVIHINFNRLGVESAGFFGGAGIPCVNGNYNGAYIPWNTNGEIIPPNTRQTILFEVEGDYLTITSVGIGSLVFYHPDISTQVAATTAFWWEPAGDTAGANNRKHVGKLYRVWANAPALNVHPQYGSKPQATFPPLLLAGNQKMPGRLDLTHRNAGVLTNGTAPASARVMVGGYLTTTIGGKNRARNATLWTEGLYSSNVDAVDVGSSVTGYAPMNVDQSHSATLSSAAGAETTLKSVVQTVTLNAGDWEEYEFRGQLVGSNAKKIRLVQNTYAQVYFDSTTTLDALTGPYTLKVFRGTNATTSHVMFIELIVSGQAPIITRYSGGPGYVWQPVEFKTTTVNAGGITIDLVNKSVNRIKDP